MTSKNLYELSTELAVLEDELETAEGELFPELEARLDACILNFNTKVENIGKWCINLKSHAAKVDAEIERLQARKKTAENKEQRLKAYLLENMLKVGKKKMEFGALTLTLCLNPKSVLINPEQLPAQYKTIKTEIVIDKRALLDDLKKGIAVKGAAFKEDKFSLRIK